MSNITIWTGAGVREVSRGTRIVVSEGRLEAGPIRTLTRAGSFALAGVAFIVDDSLLKLRTILNCSPGKQFI